MRGKQIERAFAELGKDLSTNLTRAVRETAREGLAIARQDSRGKYSLYQLRRMGHPYARRAPNPPQDPAIINRQSGVFLAAWRVEPVRSYASGEIAAFIINDSDRVRWLTRQGTRLMIGRPIEDRVRHRVAPVFLFNVERAVARTLRR